MWFRVKTLGHKNAVIYDGGFGHAVSAAPLEKFEAEISYMDSLLYLGDGKNSGHGAWSELPCLQVLNAGTSVLGR